jgi:hypothetical protein
VGQAAACQHLDDGQHQVSIHGRTAMGATLAEAIEAAREQQP